MKHTKNAKPNGRWRWMSVFALVALIITMLINAGINIWQSAGMKELDYTAFLALVDSGEIESVSAEDDSLTVVMKNSGPSYIVAHVDDAGLAARLYERSIPYSGVIAQRDQGIFSMILSWLLPLIIFIGLGFLIVKQWNKRDSSSVMSFSEHSAKVYAEKSTGKSFADVAGAEEAKEQLREIVDYLHEPQRYKEIGAQLPKGALLVGPPGTGKTLLAKAVAGEASVPFFSITGSSFVEMFVGVGASRVRDLFKQAEEKAPCIVFIDEIDALGKSRASANAQGGNDEREQTLNQLLSEMDGFDASKGVVILAATNRPEVLDPALLRPGRFDRRVIVDKPDMRGRLAILNVHTKDVKLTSTVNLNLIARRTPGAVGADMAGIVNEAALRAVRQGRRLVEQEDLDEAVETVIAGRQLKDRILNPEEKRIVAWHEAGHALIGYLLPGTQKVEKITIVPRAMGALGFVMHADEEDRYLLGKDELMGRITSLMGGRAAEELLGVSTTGAENDIEQATKLARSMASMWGMTERFGLMALESGSDKYLGGRAIPLCSERTLAALDDEAGVILKSCYEEARRILRDNEDTLGRIARQLLEHETLTGDELGEIVVGLP